MTVREISTEGLCFEYELNVLRAHDIIEAVGVTDEYMASLARRIVVKTEINQRAEALKRRVM